MLSNGNLKCMFVSQSSSFLKSLPIDRAICLTWARPRVPPCILFVLEFNFWVEHRALKTLICCRMTNTSEVAVLCFSVLLAMTAALLRGENCYSFPFCLNFPGETFFISELWTNDVIYTLVLLHCNSFLFVDDI